MNSNNFVDLLLLFSGEKYFIYNILTFLSSSTALFVERNIAGVLAKLNKAVSLCQLYRISVFGL